MNAFKLMVLCAALGCGYSVEQVDPDSDEPDPEAPAFDESDTETVDGTEVRVRESYPGEYPAYVDTFLMGSQNGNMWETRKNYNPDGTEWFPPTVSDKARFDCAGGRECPCYRNPDNVNTFTDNQGNDTLHDGTCMTPDNGNITYNVIRKVTSPTVNEIISTFTSAGISPGIPNAIAYMNDVAPIFGGLPDGYHISLRPATGGAFPANFPAGWYEIDNLPFAVPWPTDDTAFPTQTDIVLRAASIPVDNSWYGSGQATPENPNFSYGVIRMFFATAAGSNPKTVPNGVLTTWKTPLVFSWQPDTGGPFINYVKISGSVITVNQSALNGVGTTSDRDQFLSIHVFCHEVGHNLGLGHVSVDQSFSCMSRLLAVQPATRQDEVTWKFGQGNWLLNNALRVNNMSEALLCSQGFYALCQNGSRPPLGVKEY